MQTIELILSGFQVALTLSNLLFAFIGALVGTIIGVLPGLGPVATMALLLPITYNMTPEAAIIMLAGIYCGAMYGGSTTSILVNLPGESASVITCIDGYQMAKQGRAGVALGIAAIGSFIGATLALIGLSFFAPVVSRYAVRIGPPEFTTLMMFGILLVCYVGSSSALKSVTSAAIGLLIACIGLDLMNGVPRLTFGTVSLLGGLDFAAVAMGLFGLGEILSCLDKKEETTLVTEKISQIWPSLKDFLRVKYTILRGAVFGFLVGILPGCNAVVSSLLSYTVEKKRSKHPEEFGKGAIEGVAGPETANNATSISALIPLLTLGIPPTATMAMLFGALMIHGVTPGPYMINEHPTVFWGLIASLYIGNVILIVLNLPMVGLFVKLLKVRLTILAPTVIIITMLGVYSISNNTSQMWIVLIFGAIGYMMRKYKFDAAPMILALILGPRFENSFRQSLVMSNGNFQVFLQRPVALFFLIAITVMLVSPLLKRVISSRRPIKEV